ncbi:MAG: ferredoxin--NADP reductase [Nitrososphaeraceae archaeon]
MTDSTHDNDIYEWQIVNKKIETHDTNTYTFVPTSNSHKFSFNLGQFVTLIVNLKRPSQAGNLEDGIVERAYSIASSPTRDHVELTIKKEKPYGYINPISNKADGFAAYFFEQMKIGDKVKVKPNKSKNHFLSKIAEHTETDIAYWSGSNGAESARCLIQYLEDTNKYSKNPEFKLILFYSNPKVYKNTNSTENNDIDIIYYDWLLEMAKKLENFKVVFTFTREKDIPLESDHPRIFYRTGRFFKTNDGNSEKTLSKYHGNTPSTFNPICGSSAFISGIIRENTGNIVHGRGIVNDLLEIEGINSQKIDREQYYLQMSSGA